MQTHNITSNDVIRTKGLAIIVKLVIGDRLTGSPEPIGVQPLPQTHPGLVYRPSDPGGKGLNKSNLTALCEVRITYTHTHTCTQISYICRDMYKSSVLLRGFEVSQLSPLLSAKINSSLLFTQTQTHTHTHTHTRTRMHTHTHTCTHTSAREGVAGSSGSSTGTFLSTRHSYQCFPRSRPTWPCTPPTGTRTLLRQATPTKAILPDVEMEV